MPDKDALRDWERSREEEYFLKKNNELIEQLHRRAEAEAERRKMAATLGITDDAILSELQALGYNSETARLVYVAPLIQVAWVYGGVSNLKREELLEAARLNGVTEGSTADAKLAGWMENRPPDQFFRKNLQVLRAVLQSLPPEQREITRRELLAGCHTVASVSGGVLGLGHSATREEHAVIERIAEELG
jgi:hypothetical protein